MQTRCRAWLKAGREKAARRRHPWVYSGAVERLEGEAEPGELCELLSPTGEPLALGFVNPRSQILFRRLGPPRKDAWQLIRERLEQALALRRGLFDAADSDCWRLVNAEGDGLPGLTVDRYGDRLCAQIGCAGFERLRERLWPLLAELSGARGIYERSQIPARREEGLPGRSGLAWGEEPPRPLEVREQGLRLLADVQQGQKTGLYLDQRPGRLRLRELARDREVLDACSYTGGFSLNALAGGARSVTAVDRKQDALELLAEAVELNRLDLARVETLRADVFEFLRGCERSFDLVVLDPPPFARRKSDVERACRGYKELHREALRRLRPGGLLLTASCSQQVGAWLFQQLVFQASLEVDRSLRLLARWGQPEDHPVSLDHPEGEYLKVFLLAA